jgi:hypothetical protein
MFPTAAGRQFAGAMATASPTTSARTAAVAPPSPLGHVHYCQEVSEPAVLPSEHGAATTLPENGRTTSPSSTSESGHRAACLCCREAAMLPVFTYSFRPCTAMAVPPRRPRPRPASRVDPSRPTAGHNHSKACHSSPSPLRSSLEPVDAILSVDKTLASYSLLHTHHLYTSPFLHMCYMIS